MTYKLKLLIKEFCSGLPYPPFCTNTNHFRDSMLKIAICTLSENYDIDTYRMNFIDTIFSELLNYCPSESKEIMKFSLKCWDKVRYYKQLIISNSSLKF